MSTLAEVNKMKLSQYRRRKQGIHSNVKPSPLYIPDNASQDRIQRLFGARVLEMEQTGSGNEVFRGYASLAAQEE